MSVRVCACLHVESASQTWVLISVLCIAARGSRQHTLPESERKRSLSPLLSGTCNRAGKHLGAEGEQTNAEGGRGRRGRGEAGWGGELNREREGEREQRRAPAVKTMWRPGRWPEKQEFRFVHQLRAAMIELLENKLVCK